VKFLSDPPKAPESKDEQGRKNKDYAMFNRRCGKEIRCEYNG
tara:strand:- start:134 stop:259 length:126 start_codon:yes stop_codon:yes gene_type:complete